MVWRKVVLHEVCPVSCWSSFTVLRSYLQVKSVPQVFSGKYRCHVRRILLSVLVSCESVNSVAKSIVVCSMSRMFVVVSRFRQLPTGKG